MGKQLRVIVLFLLVVIGGIAVVSWWLPNLLKSPRVTRLPPGVGPAVEALPEGSQPIPVRTFKAARIDFTDVLPTHGTIRGQTEVELKFEINGMVKSLLFREGDLAQEGQVLATLEDREAFLRVEYAQSKRRTAEAQLKLAEKRESVNEQLYRLGAIILPKLEESQIEVEQAQAQLETAEKETALASAELDRLTLKAPMDGVIGTRQAEVGEVVTPQTVVATLMDVNAVHVEMGIIERDIERIRLGQRVKVTVDSVPNTPFEGTVDNLAPMVEGKSRTLTAKVKVENARGQLLPGMFARSEIAVFEKPDALVVPTSALQDTDSDGKFDTVFVAEGEKAVIKPITLGYVTTDYAEIAGGLQEDEAVISEARGVLKDGSPLSFLEEEESAFQREEPKLPGSKEERYE